jgi:hypothetical protein
MQNKHNLGEYLLMFFEVLKSIVSALFSLQICPLGRHICESYCIFYHNILYILFNSNSQGELQHVILLCSSLEIQEIW